MADKLTLIEAARIAGVSRQAVHHAVRSGALPAEWGVTARELILVSEDDLRRWILERPSRVGRPRKRKGKGDDDT